MCATRTQHNTTVRRPDNKRYKMRERGRGDGEARGGQSRLSAPIVSCDNGPISSPVNVAPATAPSGLGGRGCGRFGTKTDGGISTLLNWFRRAESKLGKGRRRSTVGRQAADLDGLRQSQVSWRLAVQACPEETAVLRRARRSRLMGER